MRFKMNPRMKIWGYYMEIKLCIHIGAIKEHDMDWHFEVLDASRVPKHLLDEIEKIKY